MDIKLQNKVILYLASEVSSHTTGMGMHIDSKVSAAS